MHQPSTVTQFRWDNSYAERLPGFYVSCAPSVVPNPVLLRFNSPLAEELGLSVITALRTVKPLKQGQTTAPEYKQRQPVDIEVVRLTAEHLSPHARAIITLQAATGMRPSEIFNMRPCDIDRNGAEWFYRPEHHKTESHGVAKAVPIIGLAKDALMPFLLRPADAYCFSPAESAQWHRDQRTANRTTPKKYGNRPGTNRKENPKRKPGTKFNKDNLNQAVERACKKAKVAKWTPYQLRHTAATAVADALGMDGARALLGHTAEAMTRRYVHQKQDEAKAIEAARVRSRFACRQNGCYAVI